MEKYYMKSCGSCFCLNYFQFNTSTPAPTSEIDKSSRRCLLKYRLFYILKINWTAWISCLKDFLIISFWIAGMLPSHMQHPFVDRYRDSHNASPRSLTDEDTMNPPTSGNSGQLVSKNIVGPSDRKGRLQLHDFKVEHVKRHLHNMS